MEKVTQTITCKKCSSVFSVTDRDEEFYAKLKIPVPIHCPQCREIRRLMWRNENVYYQRKCDLCGRRIISLFSEDKPYKIYCNQCWWGDKWNGMDYGRDFDFSKPFFEQFAEFQKAVPVLSMSSDEGIGSENCEYCQDFSQGKNCYLVTGSWKDRDCMYCNNSNSSKNLVDCSSVNWNCELVYESTYSKRIYNCCFLNGCDNCHDCYFGIDLKGCSDCFSCVGLRQKRFHIFNKPYSESEYKNIFLKKSAEMASYEGLEKIKKEFAEFSLSVPRRAVNQVNCENCMGDNLFDCKNCFGFDISDVWDSKYLCRCGEGVKNCYDIWQSGTPQWCCDCMTPDNSYETFYCLWCWRNHNLAYCDTCMSSWDLFGCIGLKRAKYCIFNKQYSKEEYFSLREKIIEHMKTPQSGGEWGEFFPGEYSHFAYNESLANEFYPLTREEVLAKGLKWKESEKKDYKPQTFVIPDSVKDVPDKITEEILACVDCGKNYKVLLSELNFYKKLGLPVPRKCPACRRSDRFKRANPLKLWNRSCAKCGREMHTSYAPERPEIVYCEKCYLESVY